MQPNKMTGIVLNPNNLETENSKSSGNISVERDNVSDSEIESDLSAEKNSEILGKLEMYQNTRNILLPFSDVSNERNAVKTNLTNITLQNSTNTRFGNETNYHAPVTINHSEIKNVYNNKNKEKNPIKKYIYISIGAVVIFSLILTLILILKHRNDGEDDDSIISK